MKHLILAALLSLPALLPAQLSTTCAKALDSVLAPEKQLSIDIRSGDIEIVGSARSVLRVTCKMHDGDNPESVKVSLAANHLRVYGGPSRDVHFRIEVPGKTNLLVRATAGDLTISGVIGDKDVELRAGDLTIAVGSPDSYRVAEASLLAGDLNASAFGVVKGGMFRSFRKDNLPGQYRLRAKLMAGDLTLK